eukprot:COSAG02_NODE_3975_length_5965_cov_5.092226_5_plen_60_part_00
MRAFRSSLVVWLGVLIAASPTHALDNGLGRLPQMGWVFRAESLGLPLIAALQRLLVMEE